MTEKEKAEAYDEAIERAKKLYGNGIIEEIFPELKESKDKRIREAILNGLIDCRDAPDLGWSNFGGIHIDDCIAWLEEQGKKSSWKPSKEEMDVLYSLSYITNEYDEHKEDVITHLYQDLKREFFNDSSYENMFSLDNKEDEVRLRSTIQVLEYARSLDAYNQYGKADIDKNIAWLENQEDKDKLIQELGEYKVKYTQEVLEKYINSMSNKDDERLRKTAIAFLKDFAEQGYENAVECIDWLEKQGKQKPCMVQWKGDNLKEVIGFTGKDKNFEKWFKSFEEYEKYVHEHNDIFKLFNENGSHYEIPVGAWIVKTPDGYNIASNAILKQKSTDKIEPKFKVGDWVVNKFGDSWHIDSLDKKNYQVSDGKGNYNYFPISKQDEIHLWTIQDAKDGDVIFYDEGWICIFKCIHGIWYSSYCFITDDGEFHTGYERHAVDSTIHGNAHPATKEHRDILMKAMNDAGYEWYAEKKELNY